ncbi:MAG: carboxylating nicotinate-nucleotide diphosphorylase [Flavobacteriales bacterium]|nr:carboxylating nicotinate-nucleotide diphosphorylase [Flavobacteriales bacterium]
MKDVPFIDEFLGRALAEDIGDGDHTSLATIPKDATGAARLLVKDEGIIAGIDIARRVFYLVDAHLEFHQLLFDGQPVSKGDVAFTVSGSARSITTAERLALNIMQRMSGIASYTHRVQQLMTGTNCKVLDTRKTTPGFRYFEKLAVRIGGGENHRFGLYDMILVKDNHVDYAGGMDQALRKVSEYVNAMAQPVKVEVEARNLEDVRTILQHGIAIRILLDNFSPALVAEAVELIARRCETEASGGINENNVRDYALTGVDFISMGALTHSAGSLDLSLKAIR